MASSPPSKGPQIDPKERFFRYFQHEIIALQEQMERLSDTPAAGGERSDAIDHCLAGIARLSHEVKDAASYVPAYDQRTYGEAIKALSEKLSNIRTTLTSRPKFTFKTRKNPSAISLHDAAELAAQKDLKLPGYTSATASTPSTGLSSPLRPLTPPSKENDASTTTTNDPIPPFSPINKTLSGLQEASTKIRKPSFSSSPTITLANHTAQHIILPPSASHATSSGTLSTLQRCVIDMSQPTALPTGPFATLSLRDIIASLIICGQVSGAAHLTRLSGSVVVAACRQFRMHDSHDTDVYLQCGSRPIIEGCTGIRFAPLPGYYGVKGAQVREPVNWWREVDDFKWLKEERSPNWRVLEEDERVKEEVWEGVVQGGPGVGLEVILERVGIGEKVSS